MVNMKLKTNHAYKFYVGFLASYQGVVLSQNENWVKIRYHQNAVMNGKVVFVNLDNVKMLREL